MTFIKTIKMYWALSWKNKLALLFSQPFLIFLLPRTYWRLFKDVFNPKKINKYVTGFSPHTAVLFPYYLRFGDLIKKYGKMGYSYEDGLGFSLKERFWFNPVALKIYNKLRIQKFTILTAFILLLNIVIIGFLENIPGLKLLILIILIGGSPLFLIPIFRMAKPEILSWAFFPLAFYTFFKGYYLASAIICFIISVLNFTTSLLIINTIVLYSLFSANFINGVLVSIIPVSKLLFDSIPFFKKSFVTGSKNSFITGLLEVLGGGSKIKSHESKRFLKLHLKNLYLIFFYLIFVASFVAIKTPLSYWVILISPIVLFMINQNLFRVADDNTFFRFFLVISSVFVILHPSPLSLIAYVIFIYLSPAVFVGLLEDIPKDYPHLNPYSIKQSHEFLKQFFSQIPSQARIISEITDTELHMAGFWKAFYYFEYILSKRNIELIPMEWFRLTQLDYFMKEYIKINSKSSREVIEKKCKELGANYIMVYSKNFADNLKKWGYKKIKKLKWEELKESLFNLKELPKKDLYIFQPPFTTSLIEPITKLYRAPNKMEFITNADTEYIIKYNYHPCWEAFQSGKKIKIYKTKGNLSYLSLYSKKGGKTKLQFNTSRLK